MKKINFSADFFAVIYNDDIEIFPKERLNDFLFKNGCLICNLKTAKDYKKSHLSYVISDEKWIRDFFDVSFEKIEEENYEKNLYYSQNRFV